MHCWSSFLNEEFKIYLCEKRYIGVMKQPYGKAASSKQVLHCLPLYSVFKTSVPGF